MGEKKQQPGENRELTWETLTIAQRVAYYAGTPWEELPNVKPAPEEMRARAREEFIKMQEIWRAEREQEKDTH